MAKKARVIAFYLPQYHPIPENDKWWGKGFTEWTNVGKAKPLFRGHYQPRVPADLGYYDLRLPEVREAQAELAREAGIEGFCYWHYWFGNGKRLLEKPFNEVLASGKPDFPFCLGWGNHSWEAKDWNSENTHEKKKILIEQTYPGEEDYRNHFNEVLKAFRDPRYLKHNNKPIFHIFDAFTLPENFIDLWNKWAIEAGFTNGIYFVANVTNDRNTKKSKKELLLKGFDSVCFTRIEALYFKNNKLGKALFRIRGIFNRFVFKIPIFAMDYKKAYPYFVGKEEKEEDVIPFMLPNWDHTPRSGRRRELLINSTPELFKEHVKDILRVVSQKDNKLVFLKSWNEWAEGNYMEPDLKFGKGYIKALREVLDDKR